MGDLTSPLCRVCRHGATGSCPNCGGYLGMPSLGVDEPEPVDVIAANMPPGDTYYIQPPHWPPMYPDEIPDTFPDWMPPA